MSDRRFHTLDAMRGVAALGVVTLHAAPVMHIHSLQKAYLAVDFFFMLSGFVLARAYEPKLKASLSGWRFIEMRFIRLYPLFALGVLLGVIAVAGQIATHSINAPGVADTIKSFAMNILMLPAIAAKTTYFFPLNLPAWSLFFELVVNALFGLFLYRMPSSWLAIGCAVTGVLYFFILMKIGAVGWKWVNSGYALDRVCFSFPLGMLLGRLYGTTAKHRSFVSLLLIGVLLATFVVAPLKQFDYVYDAVIVILVMPPIVWFGAHNDLPKPLEKIGSFLGDVSYPIYAIHFPLVHIFEYMLGRRLHLPPTIAGFLFFAILIFLSWSLSHYFDAPIRRWLSARSKLRPTAMPVVDA